ncbi:MAG TPA: cysteine desulfurase family protein [Candidatus Nanoarchaeia archaeon]|nr:cysteine desulfurase family protein [Candidatus Nanoarchaeia archaeon]
MTPIYLDNAASTMVAPEVVTAMQPYLTTWYGNPSSTHSLGRQAHVAIENARNIIAKKINAKPNEIIFTSGGTESNVLALTASEKIMVSTAEHSSILNCVKNSNVTYCPVDKNGFVDYIFLKKNIEKNLLVSIIHGNNEIGTINNIEAIGKLCRQRGALFHTDASQSFLKVPIDIQKMNIDLLTLNSHKIHGPKGIGALFVRDGIRISPLFRGSQEKQLRAGTQNVPGIVGFAKAVELWKNSDNLYIKKLRDMLIKKLLSIPKTRLNGSKDRLCNNVNISFKNVLGETIVKHLDSQGVCASTGSACTSHQIEPSHVLKAISLPNEWALGSVRFSLSRYTTTEEINTAIALTKTIVASHRKL